MIKTIYNAFSLLIIMVLSGNTLIQCATPAPSTPESDVITTLKPNDASTTLNQNIDFEYKEIIPGMRLCSMVRLGENGKEIIGSISITQGKIFAPFASIGFDADPNLVFLITLTRTIKRNNNLHDVVVLGDLYIPVAHRGKGFAQQLVNKICQQAFYEGVKSIVLNPDPCEYKNGELLSLHDSPDYADKQQRLIKLYQKCGFMIDDNDTILLMHRNA